MIDVEDISALEKVIDLVEEFSDKNPIRKRKFNFTNLREKTTILRSQTDANVKEKTFGAILKKLKSIIQQDLHIDLYFLVAAHGGVIIEDSGFCEFDSPQYALGTLIKRMEVAIKTGMPYNLEIAVCCLEWLKHHHPSEFSEFLEKFQKGRFEIINPSYAQPYNLIIGPEANIKHFEYGLKILKELNLPCDLYYCSESSLHPQIPQILKLFNISKASLRNRLLGMTPTAPSAHIGWIGLDGTEIDALIDQSGVFNGEYWHGAFFKEFPSLLFQAVARPFMNYILHSSLEDFINESPYQEEIWRISRYSEIFGKFLLGRETFDTIQKDGEYQFKRDSFLIGDYIFVPNELLLQNKNSETALITAEILHTFLGLFKKTDYDSFFDSLWRKLLLIQAHDCYAVPFVHTGDYTFSQLGKEETERLGIKKGELSISDLGIQIHKEIQERCAEFIKKQLESMITIICSEITEDHSKSLIIFNPTPYSRRDLVQIPLEFDNAPNVSLVGDDEKYSYDYINSTLSFIPAIPPFGFKIYNLKRGGLDRLIEKQDFLYDIKILEDTQNLSISFKGKPLYELTFETNLKFQLSIMKEMKNDIEHQICIQGLFENNQAFDLNLKQYAGVNRIEFYLEAHLLKEIVIFPKKVFTHTLINYPFGIEETKRNKIQTLDFLWILCSDYGLTIMPKNSQQFTLDKTENAITNIIRSRGKYEFAIAVNNEQEILQSVSGYHYKLVGASAENKLILNDKFKSFLSIKPDQGFVNLWRREEGSYIRLYNPNQIEVIVNFEGLLITPHIDEINLNYKKIRSCNPKNLKINPWELKTYKL